MSTPKVVDLALSWRRCIYAAGLSIHSHGCREYDVTQITCECELKCEDHIEQYYRR